VKDENDWGLDVRLFRHRANGFSDLEQELRRQRPVPPRDLLDQLVADSRAERGWARPLRARLAVAGGLTALLVVALAMVGGLGQAASGGRVALQEVKHVVGAPFSEAQPPAQPPAGPAANGAAATTTTNDGSLSSLDPPPSTPPGQDQYKPGCGRGDPNEPHTGPPGNHNGFDDRCPPSAPPPVTPLP
jgi:hypothetical protein